MTKENWEQLEQLWQQAQQLPPQTRKNFVLTVAGADDFVRQEVLAMLELESSSAEFLEKPAIDDAARSLAQAQLDAPDTLLTGQRLSHYEIGAQIGAGGMGTVYLARDLNLKRAVAVKVLPEYFLADRNRLDRFNREAEMLARVNHPNIATIYDFDRENIDRPRYLVMEYVPGETLAERLKRGRLKPGETANIFRQIATALQAAHAQNVIHRDLKPANIKITEDGTVKVLDFGLAKETKPEISFNSLHATERAGVPTLPESLTKTQMIIGTPGYMSPEQIRGETPDQRTDWWAFGIMLFEALTGRHPFRKPTANETMAAILEREPDWDLLPKQTPPNLGQLLRACLPKIAAQRLGSARHALQLLDKQQSGWDWTGLQKFTPRVTMKTLAKTLAAAATVLLAAFGAWQAFPLGAKIPVEKNLAVVAFKNQNPLEKDGALLGAGLAAALRQGFEQWPDVRVVPYEQEAERDGNWRWLVSNAGANLIVSGTVQTEGELTRIDYALQNAEGKNILAEKIVAPNLQAAQAQVAAQIAKALGAPAKAQAQANDLPDSEKYQRYLKALALLQNEIDKNTAAEAILLLEGAGNTSQVQAALGRAYLAHYKETRDDRSLQKALVACDLALSLKANEAEINLTLGHLHLEKGNFPLAINAFQRVLEQQPKNVEAAAGLAAAYDFAEKPDEAKKTFADLVQRNPNDRLAAEQYGAYLYDHGEYAEAEKNWLHVEQLLPNSYKAKINLGNVYLKQEKFPQAVANYQLANTLQENANAYNGLGMVHFQQENFAYAAEAFKKATELRPDDYFLWSNLGDAYRQIDTQKTAAPAAYENAVTLLQKSPRLNQDSGAAESLIAEWRAKQGGHEAEAEKRIRKAFRTDPENIEVQATAVKVFFLLGKKSEALQLLQQIITANYPVTDLRKDIELKDLLADEKAQKILLLVPKQN